MTSMCKVYITPEDVYEKLSDEDKMRFNKVIFVNQYRECDGTISIECALVNDDEQFTSCRNKCRHRIFSSDSGCIKLDDE